MLPDVRGGVRRNKFKDLEMEVESLRGIGGIREGRGVWEDRVVNSVVWDSGVSLRLVSHFFIIWVEGKSMKHCRNINSDRRWS